MTSGPDYRTAEEYFADKARAEKWERTHGDWAPDLPPCLRIGGREVRVELVNPPIPERAFDWVACFADNDIGDPQGYGPTFKAALQDLADKVQE